MDIEQARFNMIEQQIRPAGVLDPQVLETLASVRRELFVPEPLRALAFADLEIPLGNGQRMFAPKIEALFLQAAGLRRTDRVLEIGTGSGFMAALLARRAGWVYSLEIDSELARQARANLAVAAVDNVCVETSDGIEGWLDDAPYDVIVASGAVHEIPAAWRNQLAPGGRILAFVGKAPVMSLQVLAGIAGGEHVIKNVYEGCADTLKLSSCVQFEL